jgi:hypothetical protein
MEIFHMNTRIMAATLVTSALLLSGCGSDDDDNTVASVSSVPQTYLQAVHASSDAPLANVWVNGSPAVVDVDYATASGFVTLDAGMNSVQVDVQTGLGNTATVIPESSLDLMENTRYTVLVTGYADSSLGFPVKPTIITRTAESSVDASSLEVQVVHASAGVPDVDLYVTAPGADIEMAASIDTLAYEDDTGVLPLPAGDYQVRLTLAGTKTVAFDSGSISLAAGTELTIAAIPNTNGAEGASPVKLLVMDGTSSQILYGSSEQAQIRVGHLVNDAPVVDVSLNGTEAIPNLAFNQIVGYVDIASGEYDVGVYPDNTPSTLVIDAPQVPFAAAMDYSVYAVGTLATIMPLVVEDERRSVATSAVLNVLHAVPNAAAATVDVYVTATNNISESDPAIPGFAYKESVQQVYLPAGSYWVTVALPGTKTAAIGPVQVTVENGKVYQAIAIELAEGAGFDLRLDEITE